MLVKFETNAFRSITMFGDVALKLLKLMGRSGRVPGAILPEDIPEALQRLRAGIAAEEAGAADEPAAEVENEHGLQKISLKTRAFPLFEMLEAAEREQVPVMWSDGVTRSEG